MLTPSRWLPPLRFVKGPPMAIEFIGPTSPPRTMLARSAFLGLLARDAVHDRMRWHERDERGSLRVVP